VTVHEVRWDNDSSQPADDYGNGNTNHQLGTSFFIHKGIMSAV